MQLHRKLKYVHHIEAAIKEGRRSLDKQILQKDYFLFKTRYAD